MWGLWECHHIGSSQGTPEKFALFHPWIMNSSRCRDIACPETLTLKHPEEPRVCDDWSIDVRRLKVKLTVSVSASSGGFCFWIKVRYEKIFQMFVRARGARRIRLSNGCLMECIFQWIRLAVGYCKLPWANWIILRTSFSAMKHSDLVVHWYESQTEPKQNSFDGGNGETSDF